MNEINPSTHSTRHPLHSLISVISHSLEQWIVSFEAYDKALLLLKHQPVPDDTLRGELQLSYSEAKKKAKQVRPFDLLSQII